MKNLISYISDFLGVLIILVTSYCFALQFDIPVVLFWILCIIFYCLILNVCAYLTTKSFVLAAIKNYKVAILIQTLVSWYDIEYFVRFVDIVSKLKSKKDLETVQKYFHDENTRFQHLALFLYAQVDAEPVIKWYEDTYLSKNLPIDPDFEGLYGLITNEDTPDKQSLLMKKNI